MRHVFGEAQKDVLGRKVLGSPAACKFCGAGIQTYDKVFFATRQQINAESKGVLEQSEIDQQAHEIAKAEIEKGLELSAVTISTDGNLIWYRTPIRCCSKANPKPAPKQSAELELDDGVKLNDIRVAWKIFTDHFGRSKGLTPDLERIYLEQLSHLAQEDLKKAIAAVMKDSDVKYEKILPFILENTKKPIKNTAPSELSGLNV